MNNKIYVYEGHLGDLYVSDRELSMEELYCEQCFDYDWYVGEFYDEIEFIKYYKNEIDYNGSGGWNIDYIIDFIKSVFKTDITKKEIINIIKE